VRAPTDFTRMDMKKRVVANYLAELIDHRGVTMEEAEKAATKAFVRTPKRLFKV